MLRLEIAIALMIVALMVFPVLAVVRARLRKRR